MTSLRLCGNKANDKRDLESQLGSHTLNRACPEIVEDALRAGGKKLAFYSLQDTPINIA